ncbi:hypothetical protein [Microbacterium candidum]|uniref:Uncharacterized protein n=1 Tax=Microbacterium candidum TaxID=3041922 RepID=A0ABT7N3L9_9MICO|nr:hypothetical protein [Microbacterium sp. ASV49]MDL9981288.1 hypothetical protein [Microbacterium sp. ASV49]
MDEGVHDVQPHRPRVDEGASLRSALTSGPRGRRVCLEVARQLSDEVAAATHRLAYQRTAGVVHLTVHGAAREDEAGEPECATPAVAGLAELIADVAVEPHTDVDSALGASVDAAMYWQPRDEFDVVAAEPTVAKALVRIADRLATHPGASWWTGDRRPDQWAIEWHDPGGAIEIGTDPEPRLQSWREQVDDEEQRARSERPADVEANWSGTWWSSPSGFLVTTGTTPDGVPAGLRLVEDSLGWISATAIPVRGAGRTYEIRTAEDWARLCRRHPLEVTASRRHDWYRTTGRDGRWLIPDWQAIAEGWDAVHLTVAGYLGAATRPIRVDDEFSTVLAGWGPDATLWLTASVREWEGPRIEWRRDGDVWMQDTRP